MTEPDQHDRSRSEPLDAVIWFRQIKRLRADLEHADSASALERALRRAFYLSCLTPDDFSFLFGSQVQEEDFEACMANGDIDAGFAMMVSARLEFAIRKRNGSYDAVVRMFGSDLAGHCQAKQRGRAALGAWIACIVAVAGLETSLVRPIQSTPA